MKQLVLTMVCVAWCALACAAGGIDSLRNNSIDSMQYLSNVVVYAVKPYSEVIPAQVLSGKTLQGLNSHSVADAIRYFSGVQLKDYGGVGGLKTVDVRSMGTNHLGVFYDGVQLGNAQNGQVDLGKFSLDNMEEISLYHGQKSDIFQTARDFGSAGNIYLRTRHPKFEPGKRNNFNVTLRTGSFGLANPSLRWEHKLSRRVSLLVNTEWTYATGQYHFRYHKMYSDGTVAWDTTAVRKNGDLHAFRAEGGFYGVTEQGRWNAKFYFYDSERGIPGAIVNNVFKRAQRQWDRNFFVQTFYQTRVTQRYSTMVNAKWARDYLRYLNPDTTLMLIDNRFWQDEIYVSSANKYTLLTDWDINLSLDYKWNRLSASLDNFGYPQRHTALAALATAYTWRRFKAQASALFTLVNDRASVRQEQQVIKHRNNTTHKLTPAVFVSYHPWLQHDFNVRAYYKRIFRMPTFNDLYYTDIGNANLQPEHATQYNVGMQWQRFAEQGLVSAMRFSADAYYNLIDNKIVAIPTGSGQYRWTMMNIGKVRIRGIDLSAKLALRLSRQLTLDGTLSYTYQRAQDYSSPSGDFYKGQIAYIPWHSGSATAHLAWQSLDVNYSFVYVGERYHSSANIPINHEQPWYTHDLAATYAFALGRVALRASIEVNNLFNQQYDVIHNYPMPGRNYKFVIKFDI